MQILDENDEQYKAVMQHVRQIAEQGENPDQKALAKAIQFLAAAVANANEQITPMSAIYTKPRTR